ncbi:pfs domain-containing protein [Seiridium cupressi]
MEVVGAAASFIAIGQALATIPKLIRTIQAVANTRQELDELLSELKVLGALYDEVDMCFELIRSDDSLNNIVANEPWQEQRSQTKLLVEIHAVTTNHGTTRDAYSLPNNDVLWEASAAHSDYPSKLLEKGYDPCTCSCHTSSVRVVSIRSFWPLSTSPCACSCRKGRFEMNYRFLKWLARRALHVAAYVNGANISISLSIPVVVEWSVAWVIIDERSENDAFQWLTRTRTSPMDVGLFRESIFEYAVSSTLRDTSTIRLRRFDELQCLIEHGADVKKMDFGGNTPLHLAAMNHLEHFAESLLNAGCDIDHVDRYGRPALFDAIQVADEEGFAMVTFLIQRGASLHVRDAEGNSVLHELSRSSEAASGIERYFADLMDAGSGSMLETRDKGGMTPLLWAIRKQNPHMVRLLLQAGAQTDVTDNEGWNILHHTASSGSYDIMQHLSQGKIANIDIRAVNSIGWAPLEYLWRSPSTEEIQAFEHLLRDVRDRMIHRECAELEQVLSAIQTGDTDEARRALRKFTDAKVTAKIDWEAETFRAIELDVRKGDVELAVQSIEEFIEASKARLEVSPFDEEDDSWLESDSESNVSDSEYEIHKEDEEASGHGDGGEREVAFGRKDGGSDSGGRE